MTILMISAAVAMLLLFLNLLDAIDDGREGSGFTLVVTALTSIALTVGLTLTVIDSIKMNKLKRFKATIKEMTKEDPELLNELTIRLEGTNE